MTPINVFEEHVQDYDLWYEEYPEVFQSEILAIRDQMLKLGPNLHGIEIGLGTGQFSRALGIKEGIEPSKNMSDRAIKRGIEVFNATAEHLPYKSLSQDFVLFVTICHLDNIKNALKEAHRVLKRGASIIIAFLKADGKIAESYTSRKSESTFYKNANFYKIGTIEKYLIETGFKDLSYNQTLFGELDEIEETQSPISGYDQGSFVVVKAIKRQ